MCVNTLLLLKGTARLTVGVFSLYRHLFKVFGGQARSGRFPACVPASAVDKLFKETLVLLLRFAFSGSLKSSVTSVSSAQRVQNAT